MTLTFPYRVLTSAISHASPLPIRPKPLIEVGIGSRFDSRCRLAILDTGADATVFHESLAQKLGIDLTIAPAGFQRGVGGQTFPLRFAQIDLRITDGVRQAKWSTMAAFTPAKMRFALLGMFGCLQFFTASFHGDLQVVELSPNATFPGIITP